MISDVDSPSFSEYDLIQSCCRESFEEFIHEFWDILIPETPVWNWHIRFLCSELQSIAENVFERKKKLHDLVVNIPPGTTKSTIISVMFPVWCWTRDPSLRFIAASFEQDIALGFAVKSRDLVQSEKFQKSFRFKQTAERTKDGRIVMRWRPSTDEDAVPLTLREDQNAKGHYVNMARGERKSIGVGGMITGYHAHIILVDDPINPKEAVSEAGLRSVNRWWDETLPSRKTDKAVTPTILVMQRLHQDDPTGHWLEKKKTNLRHICLPARISDDVKPARLRLYYQKNGGLLDPIRLSEEILNEQNEELGKFGFAGQFMQSPIPLGGGMFEVDKIRLERCPPLSRFVQIVRYWDKAGTKDAGAFTVGAKVGLYENGDKWVLDIVRGQWAAAERERNIAQTATADGPEVVVYVEQEPGSGGLESAANTIGDTLAGVTGRADVPRGDKILRAEPFASQVGIGRVCVPIECKDTWWPKFRDELRFFPYGKLKDQVDAASAGIAKINRSIRRRVGAL